MGPAGSLRALSGLLLGCLAAWSPAPAQWTTEVVLRAPANLGGCAVGELDGRSPGNEIAAVSGDGRFYVIARTPTGWRPEEVFRAPGEVIQCALGDVDPDSPELELIGVGMAQGRESDAGPGAAYLVSRRDGRWVGEVIYETDALLHAACVFEGAVFVAGYDRQVHRLTRGASGWDAELVGELPGAGKNALAALGGVVVACTDGSVVRFKREGSGWARQILDQRPGGRSRLGVHGDQLVVSDDDGTLSILEQGQRREIYGSSAKLRGAVLADLDPDHPGLEAATAGYSREVKILLSLDPAAPDILTPFVDSDRIHHLTVGNVDGDPDLELVACGYSGLVVVLDRR